MTKWEILLSEENNVEKIGLEFSELKPKIMDKVSEKIKDKIIEYNSNEVMQSFKSSILTKPRYVHVNPIITAHNLNDIRDNTVTLHPETESLVDVSMYSYLTDDIGIELSDVTFGIRTNDPYAILKKNVKDDEIVDICKTLVDEVMLVWEEIRNIFLVDYMPKLINSEDITYDQIDNFCKDNDIYFNKQGGIIIDKNVWRKHFNK